MSGPSEKSWLITVCKEDKEKIKKIIDEKDRLPGKNRTTPDDNCSWWVRLSPTTGPAKSVVLIRKYPDGRRTEWIIR